MRILHLLILLIADRQDPIVNLIEAAVHIHPFGQVWN